MDPGGWSVGKVKVNVTSLMVSDSSPSPLPLSRPSQKISSTLDVDQKEKTWFVNQRDDLVHGKSVVPEDGRVLS